MSVTKYAVHSAVAFLNLQSLGFGYAIYKDACYNPSNSTNNMYGYIKSITLALFSDAL